MSKSTLKETFIVSKRNVLNEMRTTNMSIQELRLFSIYLSKINPKDISTKLVRFRIKDFQAIMDYKSRINTNYLRDVTDRLFTKIIEVPNEKGNGLYRFPFFKECQIYEDDDGDAFIEIEANERALPLIFEYKSNYFKYELWNALRLKGKNQLRMYEILKQYEHQGYRIISVKDLRELLGIEDDRYPQYKIFNRAVLEKCQKALAEFTDISFTYEVHSKRKNKTHTLKFTITKNKGYKDPLTLDKFIDLKKLASSDIDILDMHEDDIVPGMFSRYEERLRFFYDALEKQFPRERMVVLCDLMAEKMPHIFYDDKKCFDYLRRKYNEVKMRSIEGEVRNPFGYLKTLIGTD